MGIIDSLKSAVSGDSGDSSGFNSSQYDSSFQSQGGEPSRENPFDGSGAGNADRGDLNPPSKMPDQNSVDRDPTPESPLEEQGSPMSQGQQSGPGNEPQQPGNSSPNAQAGRPRQGASTPQTSVDSQQPQPSRETRQEMQQAGFEVGEDQGGSSLDDSDLEELKDQNEEIIDLLGQIASKLDSMDSSAESRSRGRHGGRR